MIQSCIKPGKFPTEWKKSNTVPLRKKSRQQILKNFCPISLIHICGKTFVDNNLFEYFIVNDLISQNQFGFKPGDSCINQLISITHEIYQYFDVRTEVRVDFLTYPKFLINFGMKVLFVN